MLICELPGGWQLECGEDAVPMIAGPDNRGRPVSLRVTRDTLFLPAWGVAILNAARDKNLQPVQIRALSRVMDMWNLRA